MTAAEISPILLALAAIISAVGVPLTAFLAARSVQASARNADAIAATANTVQAIEVKVDGRLSELLEAMQAKNLLEKSVSFTEGATQQRDAARGVVVTTSAAEIPPSASNVAPAPPRRPLSYRTPEG
jgi:hypothetical protein